MPSTKSPWIEKLPERWTDLVAPALALLAIAVVICAGVLEATRPTLIRYKAVFARRDLTLQTADRYAQVYGFQPEDRLLSVGGRDVSSLMELKAVLGRQELGATISVVVRRGDQTIPLNVPVRAKGINLEYVIRYALAAIFLIPCTIVAMVRPRDPAVYLFMLISISLGLYYALLRQEGVGLTAVQLTSLCLASGFIIHFFCAFPEARWIAKAGRSFLLYIPSLILLAGTLREYVWSVADGRFYWFAPRLDAWKAASFGYLCFVAVLGLGMVSYSLATTSNSTLKQQLKWLIFGLACAVLAGIVDQATTLLGRQSYAAGTLLLVGTLPAPVSFTFAILRYHLLDVDLVIRRSVAYAVLTAGLLAFYLWLVSFASDVLGRAVGSLSYDLILFLSALLIGLIAVPLRRRVQIMIDRYFFGQVVNPEQVIVRWSQELGSHLRLADLAHILVNEVPREMGIEGACLLLPGMEDGVLVPVLSTGLGNQPTDARSPLAIKQAVAQALPQTEAISFAERPANGPDVQVEQTLAAWRQAGIELVLPMSSAHQLVGVYLLGPKLPKLLYQRQELNLLRALANQAAVAISNARLYEQVRASSQVLEVKVQQRTRELSDFLSVVSHELNTPITTLQGYTDLLLDRAAGPLTDRQSRFVENMRRSAQRLGRLVLDLSDVARIDAGRLTVQTEPFDLQLALEEALSCQHTLIEEKGLRLSVFLAPDASRIQGDPQRVVQILTNLLSNACRYTPAGGRIEISSRAVDGMVETAVRDSGIGIRPEERERIFERFYRGGDPAVREQPGTGLGLSIAKSLVELQGGRIWFESVPGVGTTFTFTLPAAP